METKYIHTVTASCPPSLRDDANQLACVLGTSMADLQTYLNPQFTREDIGYSVVAFAATQEVIDGALSGTLTRPAHDIDSQIDMESAQRALGAMIVVFPTEEFEPVEAQSDKLVAYVGFEAQEAIRHMGLTLIESGEE